MRAVLAIAVLAVRAAFRSRLLISMLLALLAAVAWVPISVKGDGTMVGQIRVLLNYSLGLAYLLLGVGVLWTSCAAISQEVDGRQIRLVAVKPVGTLQIWLGKWLGLVAMNAALLACVGMAVSALLWWSVHSMSASPEETRQLNEELLVGRRAYSPLPDDLDAEVEGRLRHLMGAGQVAAGLPRGDVLRLVRHRVQSEHSTVAPGASKPWRFRISPGVARAGGVVFVRFKLASSDWARGVVGTWMIGSMDEPDRFTVPKQRYRTGQHAFRLPGSVLASGGDVLVTFVNGPREESSTAVFDSGKPVEVLATVSSFAANLVRALGILLCKLALLAAIGLSAGTVFSFPVAAFASTGFIVMASLSYFFVATPDFLDYGFEEGEYALLHRAGVALARLLYWVAGPLIEISPVSSIADGLLVPWSVLLRAVGQLGLAYPLVLGLLAAAALRRRELALPRT